MWNLGGLPPWEKLGPPPERCWYPLIEGPSRDCHQGLYPESDAPFPEPVVLAPVDVPPPDGGGPERGFVLRDWNLPPYFRL